MEASGVKVIFLDIGGVLLSDGWENESRQKAAKKFSLDYAEMDSLHHFIFNIYEIASITLNEYLDRVVFNHPRTLYPGRVQSIYVCTNHRTPRYAAVA